MPVGKLIVEKNQNQGHQDVYKRQPLALLLHRETAIQTFVDVDERSAAFFALGLSKASQKPVVLLCTSGTAAANYYPAICEANISHVPDVYKRQVLLVLSVVPERICLISQVVLCHS